MELNVQNRTTFGKKTKSLRRQGLIPAELFGHGLENKHLSVPEKDFLKAYRAAGENAVLTLITESGEKLPAVISEIQRAPISGSILTIDFHQVKMDEKIRMKVPIEFIGEAPAVKAGNILVKILNEIEVEAFPQYIPSKLEADLSVLKEIRQSIHIKNLPIPDNVKALADPETAVAAIAEPAKAEEAPVPPAEASAKAGAEEAAPPAPNPQESTK